RSRRLFRSVIRLSPSARARKTANRSPKSPTANDSGGPLNDVGSEGSFLATTVKDFDAYFLYQRYHRIEKEGRNKMDFAKVKLDPAAVFKSLQEVVSSQELSREQKIEILRRWEQDARLMEVADEESMAGPQPKLLQPIRDALHALNYWPDTEHSGPSKV